MSRPTFRETLPERIDGVYTKVVYSYWNCPRKFIPTSIIKWVGDYAMIKRFPSMPVPSLDDMCPRFKEACRYYEQEIDTAMKEVHDG